MRTPEEVLGDLFAGRYARVQNAAILAFWREEIIKEATAPKSCEGCSQSKKLYVPGCICASCVRGVIDHYEQRRPDEKA